MRRFLKKIFSFFTRTSRCGITIAIFGFLAIRVKQYVLIKTSHALFQEASWWGTLFHYLTYLVSDFFVFLVLLLLAIANTFIKKKWIRYGIMLFSLSLLLLFIVDIISISIFQSSISLFDVSSGMLDPSVVKVNWHMIGMCFVLGIIGYLVFILAHTTFFKKHQKAILAGILLFFALISLFTSFAFHPGISFPDNILSKNIRALSYFFHIRGTDVPGNEKKYLSSFSSVTPENKHVNVIVIFAESLSAIDSLKVGGVYDNLPYFDKIQSEGITFTNFLANGCTSDAAHVALLQGIEPWKFSWQNGNAYTGYQAVTAALPTFFEQQHYSPIFLSTASLSFLDQRSFLSSAGFTTIQGEDFFRNERKYVFSAAPDQSLYKQALKTISQQQQPYFLVMQTISFHKPYDTPYGDTEQDAIRYADKNLYYFYQQLKKSGFFDNGILVVVGDHRKMEPVNENEKNALGPLRYARSLATVIGTGIVPGTLDDRIIQHTDIFYSLKKLVGQQDLLVSNYFNDIFSPRKGRDWGVVFCRYFTNRYGILTSTSSGAEFEYINEVKSSFPNIYTYIQAYNDYQNAAIISRSSVSREPMIIIGHRGSPSDVTENSLEGFLLAKQHGANGIEFDISQTKDGKNVVLHGPSAYSTTCGKNILIGTHTLDWLQQHCTLTNGESIVTLEEMLAKIKGLFEYYFIEIKANTQNVEQQTLDAIQTVRKLGMENNVIFISYDKTATYLLGASKNIHAGWDTYNVGEVHTLPYFTHEYYLLDKSLANGEIAQQVADMGKKLVVYVINTRDELEQVYNQGIHIIMTDDIITMKEYADKLTLEEE